MEIVSAFSSDSSSQDSIKTRVLSNLFKGSFEKSSRSASMITENDVCGAPPEDNRRPMVSRCPPKVTLPLTDREQVSKLRTKLNAAESEYNAADGYPRHPITSRGWHHKNLKCTNCLDFACPICGRACCAYKAATAKAVDENASLEARREAQSNVQSIEDLYPNGKEVPSTLR